MLKKSEQDVSIEQTIKDRGFNMHLPTRVEGHDREGKFFKEMTSLSYISHQGSAFWLSTPTPLGSNLRLVIDLPPNLSEDQDLKLIINGKVIFIEASADQSLKQRISVNFENKYLIKDED